MGRGVPLGSLTDDDWRDMTGTPPPPPPTDGPYGGNQPPYGGNQPQQPLRPEDEKLWATLIHVGGIFYFLPSLIGYLLLRDRGPFIREHTRVALNFQLTMLIASFVGGLLSIVGIGLLIVGAVWVVNIVFSIIAALAANRGEYYRYPLSIEFIKP